MAPKHTPATIGIQRRLEKWELNHLRALCAVQAEEIERLRFERDCAEDCATMWQRGHEAMAEHLQPGVSVGLTIDGHLTVVQGGAA
jgi:hypothetical protein